MLCPRSGRNRLPVPRLGKIRSFYVKSREFQVLPPIHNNVLKINFAFNKDAFLLGQLVLFP